MYTINYGTGTENETATTIEEAMNLADQGTCYTGCDITIEDANGNTVYTRTWYGCMDGADDEENPICFGDSGFYADWI